MEYCVKVTQNAINQIQEILEYISTVLLSPDSATAWSNYFKDVIKSLNLMPNRYPLIDDEPWKSKKYHKMPIKKHIVYYSIDEINKLVIILAIAGEKQDQVNLLHNIP